MKRPGMYPYEAAGFIRFKPSILEPGDELAQYRFSGERTVCLDAQMAAWAPSTSLTAEGPASTRGLYALELRNYSVRYGGLYLTSANMEWWPR
jgi:hypothetical protein